MRTRIIVGAVLASCFLLIWWLGGIVQTIMFAIAALLCTYEMIKAMKSAGKNIYEPPLYIAAFAAAPLLTYCDHMWFGLMLFAGIIVTISARVLKDSMTNDDLIANLLVYLYPIGALSVLYMLCSMENFAISRIAMFMTFVCPLIGDAFAYFFGVAWGKTPLCPSISPKKTIEGAYGAIIGGAISGVLVYFVKYEVSAFQGLYLSYLPLYMLGGCALAVIGMLGDLFASCLKRWTGVKDFGGIFPGHGGMLDRLDSVLMCAPAVYFLFML